MAPWRVLGIDKCGSLRSSTNPYALLRVRFFFVSLWRATQTGIRCLEMWIFCLFIFNTFVFETTFVFCSKTKVAFFFCLVFSLRRAIRRLAPCGAKLFALRGSATLEHESLRTVVREVFAYIYGALKSPRFRRGLFGAP